MWVPPLQAGPHPRCGSEPCSGSNPCSEPKPLQRGQVIATGPTFAAGPSYSGAGPTKVLIGEFVPGLCWYVCLSKRLWPKTFSLLCSFVTIAQQQRLLLIAESQASNVAETDPSAVQGFISKYMNAPMQRLVVIDDKSALRPAPQRSCSPIAATHL